MAVTPLNGSPQPPREQELLFFGQADLALIHQQGGSVLCSTPSGQQGFASMAGPGSPWLTRPELGARLT